MPPEHPPRPARRSDAAAITALQSQLSEPSPQLLSAALAEVSTEFLDQPRSLQTWRLLVSPDSSGQPVGYLLAVDGSSTHIAELVVDPDHRRENRATELLTRVCETASQPVTVNVAATNEPARSLYQQVGFVEVGRSTDQFEHCEGLALRYDPHSI